MTNPVVAAQASDGPVGSRQPLGKPTALPLSLPAQAGAPNNPGDVIPAPTITSKQRNNRGTNITIPYARVVPLEALRDVGRVHAGDVVFCSRFNISLGIGPTTTRIVGIDWLNRALGGRPEYDGGAHDVNWKVGESVLLAAPSFNDPSKAFAVKFDASKNRGRAVADEWRSLTLLKEWVCDGVVLSNDEPGCFSSAGANDARLFNIAVQGVCAVNNGFIDYRGKGVESTSRSGVSFQDGGGLDDTRVSTTFGEAFHASYPLQSFGRKLRPMSEVFVGIVATERPMDAYAREILQSSAPNDAARTDVERTDSFYTFRFVLFGSTEAFGDTSDPPSKTARQHHDDAAGEIHDPYACMSKKDWHGLVGAWRVGKVLDVAATKKDQFYGGPVDTADRITLNVNVEFLDWRQLRRDFGRKDIGSFVPGARMWAAAGGADKYTDKGFVLRWPTTYTEPQFKPAVAGSEGYRATKRAFYDAVAGNQPRNPTTIDEAIRSSNAKRVKLANERRVARDAESARKALEEYGTIENGFQSSSLHTALFTTDEQTKYYREFLTPRPKSVAGAAGAAGATPQPMSAAGAAGAGGATPQPKSVAGAAGAAPQPKSVAGVAGVAGAGGAQAGVVAGAVSRAAVAGVGKVAVAATKATTKAATKATAAVATKAKAPAPPAPVKAPPLRGAAPPASLDLAVGQVDQVAPPRPARRGRAGESAADAVLASIFGSTGDATPSSPVSDASSTPRRSRDGGRG